jgi:hypothetical protein
MKWDKGAQMTEITQQLQLVHTGLVCRDMESARARLAMALGIRWVGDDREEWPLVIEGKSVRLSLRIAHASNGQANFELIEAVPDTPWVTSEAIVQHHLCFHSPESEEACMQLERQGFRRVMGQSGDPQGYFRDPAGLLIEIIGDNLLSYLNGFYQRSLEAGVQETQAI